jgi:nicotinate-nucleotide pyrophosphorylase (carboxylating)
MTGSESQRPRRITPLEPRHFGSTRFPLTETGIVALVRSALDEDAAFEDITTLATVLPTRRTRARLVLREPGVISGVPLALAAFCLLDERTGIRVDAEDGTALERGATVLHLSGHARGLLAAERTALNFMQHLSGIASLTRQFVDAVRGTRAAVVDTRKTLPGWRRLEKYAVSCGGGVNHRADLASAVLIKDNHLAAVDGDIALAIQRVRAYAPPGTPVQIEVETPEQARAAVNAGAESILLDNMSNDDMRACVAIAHSRCVTEASGGVRLDTIRAIAETGVDRISVGALTHSAPALNLALDFE